VNTMVVGPCRDPPPSPARRRKPQPAAAPCNASGSSARSAASALAAEGDAQVWSDAAIAQLHEGLLQHSLKALQVRGNAESKRDILRWIFAPDTLVVILHDGQGRAQSILLPQDCTPFSFALCCRICGYEPQRLRDALAPLLRQLGLESILLQLLQTQASAAHPQSAEVRESIRATARQSRALPSPTLPGHEVSRARQHHP
jgi:hypothetical protein